MTSLPSRGTKRSIQARVMVLVASGVLVSVLAPGWVAWRAIDEVAAHALEHRQTDATLAARHLENVINREWARLQEIASARPGASGQGAAAGAPALDVLRSTYFRAEIMDGTFVTDASGRVLAEEPAPASGPGRTIPGVAAIMASGRPGVSVADAAGAPTGFNLLVPMRDWRGQVIGTAGGFVNAAGPRVAAILRDHTAAAPGTTIEVLDDRGTVVLASDPGRLSAAKDHTGLIRQHLRRGTAVAGSCHQCHAGVARTTTVMAFVPLQHVPWGVLVETPEGTLLVRTQALRRTLLWLSPALLAIGLLFAYGAAQSVLRPVRVLMDASERIAAGSLDQPIPAVGRDEVGRLGRSLERMRAALKTSIQTIEDHSTQLERRVDERTAELQAISRQLAEREEARARLLRQVITAQEDERKRLARELHDETCQTISALAMKLGSAATRLGADTPPAVAEARDLAVKALDELHRLIYDLRPSVLDDLGLWSAIRWYAERQLGPRGVAVRCEFPDTEHRLPPLYETALFRVAQEAVSNIAKHAEAEQVLIQGSLDGARLTIEIEDDGRGFDPAQARTPQPDGHGWGLLGITERVEALGGWVTIDSAPGQGVRLVATVTLPTEPTRG